MKDGHDIILGMVAAVVVVFFSSLGIAQYSRGCSVSEKYRAGNIIVSAIQQDKGNPWACDPPKRYDIIIHNRGSDKALVKLRVGKKKLSFEVAPKAMHRTHIFSVSSPVIKQLTICKKGSCVRLK